MRTSKIIVPTIETRIEPRQPMREEKKANIAVESAVRDRSAV